MPKVTVELSVGDVLVIGDRTMTVIDIEGSEVHFRVDDCPAPQLPASGGPDSLSESPIYRTKAK